MAKKSNKAAGVAVAVGGVAALGLAAYALSQSKGDGQKEASQLLSSGGYGGGATGGYSDAFTDVTTPSTQPSISDTIADVLNKVTQTPQAQPTPIVLPTDNTGLDDIIPLLQDTKNPSDEQSDVKSGGLIVTDTIVGQPFAGYSSEGVAKGYGTALERALYSAGVEVTLSPTKPSAENMALTNQILNDYLKSQNSAGNVSNASTAVEYNPNDPFTFAPTKKQSDYSSYNQGKVGGTPTPTSKPTLSPTSGVSTAKGYTPSTPTSSKPSTPSSSSSKGTTTTSTPTTIGSALISAVGRGVNTAASTIGSFIGGLFGGK